MTKYDKPLQSGTKQYEDARKPDRPKADAKRELEKARSTKTRRAPERRDR